MPYRDAGDVAGKSAGHSRSTGLVVASSGLLLPSIFDHLPER
jgi:hypothetical protein